MEWSKSYLASEEKTDSAKKIIADVETILLRHDVKVAEALYKSAIENVRNKRAILSAGQTVATVVKDQINLAR